MNTTLLLAVLICDVGGPGTPEQAQPVVDTFLRHFEKSGGWKSGALTGAYRNEAKACRKYIDEHAPSLVAVDLPTYLEQRKEWELEPLAHMGEASAKRYHLLTREGAHKDLAALAGKTLVSPLAAHPRFLSRIVLAGRVKDDHFKLERIRRPLKGLRRVSRGQAEATIVDEAAYAYLKQLKLPGELVALYSSKPMPGLTLATTKVGRKDGRLRPRTLTALPKLCRGPGAELCKTFGVDSFVEAKPAAYRDLVRQFEK